MSTGGSVIASGGGASQQREGHEPGLRPRDLGSATRLPLANGAVCRFPPRLSWSISARQASWLARNSAIWRSSSATNASSSSRPNAGKFLGAILVWLRSCTGSHGLGLTYWFGKGERYHEEGTSPSDD
jgi:hypothetical protein